MSETDANQVRVGVASFCELFEQAALPLAIDAYQRPYVWDEEKVRALISDLDAYAAGAATQPDYYLGTLLLHENRQVGKCFIIDGQQRLTSLCILHRWLLGYPPTNCDLRYRSPTSWENIRRTQKVFARWVQPAFQPAHFAHLRFTLITVFAEDLAFTFFDTQNSRGVRPNATDLLKAYHLREITGPGREPLQRHCAMRWEKLQATQPIVGKTTDFAPALFEYLLWRARRWTGSRFKTLDLDKGLIEEFQHGADRHQGQDAAMVPLYRAALNRRASALRLLPGDEYRLAEQKTGLHTDPAELPFAIRQPISAGVGFFLYTAKYTAMAVELVHSKPGPGELQEFQNFYQQVFMPLSVYLREFFLLACVMYVDQFGHEQLLRFAFWLDHALGSVRLGKRSVYRAAPMVFLRETPVNFLDAIAQAFRPKEVIEHLKELPGPREIYAQPAPQFNVVQRRYVESVRTYYGQAGELAERATWIEQKIAQLGFT